MHMKMYLILNTLIKLRNYICRLCVRKMVDERERERERERDIDLDTHPFCLKPKQSRS